MKSLWLLLALGSALLFPQQGWADCRWSNGGAGYAGPGLLRLALPASLSVPRDKPVGAVLWSSGWIWAATGKLNGCPAGHISGRLAADIGQASGNPTVHATNVPGIGVAVFWCNANLPACGSDPLSAGVGNNRNWSEVSALNWSYAAGTYDPFTQFWVYLVKTGDVSPGVVRIGGESQVFYNAQELSRLTLTGQTTISAPSCQITSGTDVQVRLPQVTPADFPSAPGVMRDNSKAAAFSIGLLCSGNFRVSYRIDPLGGTSVGNVLDNASGAGYASGVGIQLFHGYLSSVIVLPLSTKLSRTVVSGSDVAVAIPMTAKYYRTSSNLSGGAVRASALFTLFYE